MQKINRYIKEAPNYDKYPVIQISADSEACQEGWESICAQIIARLDELPGKRKILVVDCYQGVLKEELSSQLLKGIKPELFIDTHSKMMSEEGIASLVAPFLSDHPIFGKISDLNLVDFFEPELFKQAQTQVRDFQEGTLLIYGPGASLCADEIDVHMYADMARWEIQQRMRRNEVSNLGMNNASESFTQQYKLGYFVDWRVCDRHKRKFMKEWDYVLDTNIAEHPKLISGELLRAGLDQAIKQPFRVVPFFDPGPWGGQWMKEVCNLDRSAINYAWCFDCVPEENSLLLGFGDKMVEIPSINLVFHHPVQLLGQQVYNRFGAEFPIRFDFLDTMEGGNLSLQVHPFTQYIQQEFGMAYTQDESYYMLEVEEDACVYLGMREDANREEMLAALEEAQLEGGDFKAEKYVKKWPVKKHDHVLIPAGTIHCSGKNSMVLEISATPYIFTFKLWDWGRLGLDGKPRPISLEHGKKNIAWDRTESWTERELLNQVKEIAQGDGWREEQTGLHKTEFIETRRHWFKKQVAHHTEGNLHVLNLVEGREAIIESPDHAFAPFVIHYAETVIIPAAIGAYTIRPYGESEGKECATLKAYVRP